MSSDTGRVAQAATLGEWRRWLLRQGHVLIRDPEVVFQQAANEPDGSLIWRAARDRLADARFADRAWLFKLTKCQGPDALRFALLGSGTAVTACAFHPRRESLATGDEQGEVRIWSLDSGELLSRFALDSSGRVSRLAFSQDGSLLAVGADGGEIVVIQLASGSTRAKLPPRAFVRLCGFATDVPRLLTAAVDDLDGRCLLELVTLDLACTAKTLGRHDAELVAWAFQESGHLLATADAGGWLRLWDWKAGRQIEANRCRRRAIGLAFTTEGHAVRVLDDEGRLSDWYPSAGELEEVGTATSYTSGARTGAIAPGGIRAATEEFQGFLVWQSGRDTRKHLVLEGHSRAVPCLDRAFSKDGLLFAATFADGRAFVWDATSPGPTLEQTRLRSSGLGKEWDRAREGHILPVVDCSISGDGRWLASADESGRVLLWDWEGKCVHHELGYSSQERHGLRRCILGAGREVIVCTSERLLFAPGAHYRELAVEPRPGHGFTSCAMAKDAPLAAATRADGALEIWQLGDSRQLAKLDLLPGPLFSCALSRRGRWLAAGGDGGAAFLVDLRRGNWSRLDIASRSDVLSCAFSPNRRWLALGLRDGRIILHLLRPITKLVTLEAPGATAVDRCSFAPDGALLAARSRDHWLRIWDCERATLAARAPADSVLRPALDQGSSGLSWYRDGSQLLCPGTDGGLGLYRLHGRAPAESM